VLGFISGGLTALVTAGYLMELLAGDVEITYVLLVLTGIACAAGLITGAAQLLARRSATVLLSAALAAVVSLVLVLLAGTATLYGDAEDFVVAVALFGAPLPVLTAVFARNPATTGWVAAGSTPGPAAR
jgi:hypothetical protein